MKLKKEPIYYYWQSKRNNKWYFKLVGGNGETQHPSEPYETKQAALKGIRDIKKNAPIAKVKLKK